MLSRSGASKTSRHAIWINHVRVDSIRAPENYYINVSRKRRTKASVWFRSTGSPSAIFKGIVEPVDPIHEYNIQCTYVPQGVFERRAYIPTYEINKIIGTRLVLTPDVVSMVVTRHLSQYVSDVSKSYMSMSQAAKAGNCGAIIREVGETEWYTSLESLFPSYFKEWYKYELLNCHEAFTDVELSMLHIEELARLIRLAAITPYKLCLWSSHCVGLVGGISFEKARLVANRFGVPVGNSFQTRAVEIVKSNPFRSARIRGESFVTYKTFVSYINNSAIRSALVEHNFITLVNVQGHQQSLVACSDDLGIEQKLAEEVIRIVTTPCPPVAQTPIESRRTPRLKPSEEQTNAINTARDWRLAIINGKPGTGKTTVVERAIIGLYNPEEIIGVAFSATAALRLRDVAGRGATIHHVIKMYKHNGDHADYKYSTVKVLLVEEASTVPPLLWLALLTALPSLCKIILVGDVRQMDPIGGGASLLAALVLRYRGTPICAELSTSKRVSDLSGAYVRNLDRICDYDADSTAPLMLEWSLVTAESRLYTNTMVDDDAEPLPPKIFPPFYFVPRGQTFDESIAVIRNTLAMLGINPDESPLRYSIMALTNETREGLCMALYKTQPISQMVPEFRLHNFRRGENVLLLRNKSNASVPGSILTMSDVSNGTTGIIDDIFDENLDATIAARRTGVAYTHHDDTQTAPAYVNNARWIRLLANETHPILVNIGTDTYTQNDIIRAPPFTIAKSQGQETEVAVVYIDDLTTQPHILDIFHRRDLYTACSRGKRACIVVGASTPETISTCPLNAGETAQCPDKDFSRIVSNTPMFSNMTLFWQSFPAFETIEHLISSKQ